MEHVIIKNEKGSIRPLHRVNDTPYRIVFGVDQKIDQELFTEAHIPVLIMHSLIPITH